MFVFDTPLSKEVPYASWLNNEQKHNNMMMGW